MFRHTSKRFKDRERSDKTLLLVVAQLPQYCKQFASSTVCIQQGHVVEQLLASVNNTSSVQMSSRMPVGSLRDRTADFQALASRIQKQQGLLPDAGGGVSSTHQQAKQAVQQQSEFAKKASQIGLSIHTTSMRLQKLAQLAKRTSMFDDPSREIDEMTGIIKQDIQGLNMAIADLQRISGKKAEDNKQSADHSHTVVNNLRTRLKDATQEFKDVLTMRTENLKVHKERRQLFSSQPDAGAALLERTPLLSSSSSSSEQPAGTSSSSTRPSAANLFGQVRRRRHETEEGQYLAQYHVSTVSRRAKPRSGSSSTAVGSCECVGDAQSACSTCVLRNSVREH